MPRLPELTPETAPPSVRDMMQAQIEAFGFPLNATKMMGYCPDVARAQNRMGDALDGAGNIEPELRYLVYTKVATLNGCPF